ncbi:polysaccharide deacetylase family protein [Paenibacillus pasadenensis]|uniref:polysaccharide deacetylase family protein n=1 Tax=Paenibacillus pasadenensis TaxID=217090 RepID=UPI00203ACADD|nr:polysaccharide deacetylase family protein [Paenibacillus pasadenensis]
MHFFLKRCSRLPEWLQPSASLLAAALLALLLVIIPQQASAQPIAGSDQEHSSETAATLRPGKRLVSWITLTRNFPGAFATHGPATSRRVALTFDDVPDNDYTPKVLDILAREKVKATFFIVGERALKHPDMVQRIVAEGHAVGNHSYDHTSYASLSMSEFKDQVERTNKLLHSQLGFTPRFIRPPYGEILPEQLLWTQSRGYYVVNWNVDTEDWKGLGPDQILRNVRRTLGPGSIILQHAGGGIGEDLSGTVKALPRLIQLLKQKNYELVTVPELLGKPEELESIRLY